MRQLEPGTWIAPSGSPTTDMVRLIRLAESLGMPDLADADDRLVAFFEMVAEPFEDLLDLRDMAITWLEEHKPLDGYFWGYQPDTLPPADFGLWQDEEQP